MLTADHPNAVWLDHFYNGAARLGRENLDSETHALRLDAHIQSCRQRISSSLIVHTGGLRLATTVQGSDVDRYIKRRGSLCDANVVPLELDQILADEYFGIIHGRFHSSRAGEVWERIGMGAWRFEDGIAVEHWELPSGPRWDSFFLGGDPDFEGTALEFWLKPA